MKRFRLIYLITAAVFLVFLSPQRVLASNLVEYDKNAPPAVIVRDVGLGLTIVGGVSLLASGALLIAYTVEDGRFKERFNRIRSHQDAQTLNPSYNSLELLHHMAITVGTIGAIEFGVGLVGFLWGKSLVDAKHRAYQLQIQKTEFVGRIHTFGEFGG